MDGLDSDVYSYMDSYVEDSDVDLDADRFATDQERDECLKLVSEKIYEYKKGHAFDGDRETKPFGFVSIPVSIRMKSDEESDQPASSSECDEEKAIGFLTRKMHSGLACTFDETIKTTIRAFKHLCLKDRQQYGLLSICVKAEDLWVTAWIGHPPAKLLLVNEIQNYMDIINDGSGQGGSDLDCLDSHMDLDVDSYRDSNVNLYVVDSDLDANCFATGQERDECLMVVSKKLSNYKNGTPSSLQEWWPYISSKHPEIKPTLSKLETLLFN